MKILVLNCGSSSIKYQLIETDTEEALAKGQIERIGMSSAVLTHQPKGQDKIKIVGEILDHSIAMEYVIAVLLNPNHGVIADRSEIDAVGHRVVHGGETFSGSVLITDAVLQALKDNIELAPLHNPPNLKGIAAAKEHLPNVPQCGVFDTAYHSTMPPHAFAIKHGKSIDTSMGFTPLEGLLMGTRCGDLDPSIITYVMGKEELSISETNTLLNKHSGLAGISGESSDMREIEQAVDEGDKKATYAFDIFCYRIKKYIGSYAAAMGGIDALVFTGGIGENSPKVRKAVCSELEFLGIHLDPDKNENATGEAFLSADNSKTSILRIPTNEELVIAMDSDKIVRELNQN